jgi:hypothetical protein
MPIIIVSSSPIDFLKNYELKALKEDVEERPNTPRVYGTPRRYEPTTAQGKRRPHLRLVSQQKEEE